ncbi:MAG: hypothetical protein F4X12_01135 [Acidobacteriia bacterium]|nr:hypothetical protein [Terriglobia bacterium]
MTAGILFGPIGFAVGRYVSEVAPSAASFLGFCGLSGVAGDDSLVIDKQLIGGGYAAFLAGPADIST